MLRRHSGPSMAVAMLVILASLSVEGNAQEPAAVEAANPALAAPAGQTPAISPMQMQSIDMPSVDLLRDVQPEQPPVEQVQPPEADGMAVESLLPEFASIPRSTLPHDLSPIGMFLAADWVVKGVMISLAFASLITWTIWIAKSLQMAGARLRASKAIRVISGARTLPGALGELERRGGAVAAMVRTADQEMRLSDAAIDHAGGAGVKERVGSALARIEVQAGRSISKGTGILATIGSTAPFVGLFGTVWGIMNAFVGISESQTTNLAVVAPGIAEALLATAIGLVAAIPAVIIYNMFARSVSGYRQSLADAAAGIERLVSRDLDFRKIPAEAVHSKIMLVTE